MTAAAGAFSSVIVAARCFAALFRGLEYINTTGNHRTRPMISNQVALGQSIDCRLPERYCGRIPRSAASCRVDGSFSSGAGHCGDSGVLDLKKRRFQKQCHRSCVLSLSGLLCVNLYTYFVEGTLDSSVLGNFFDSDCRYWRGLILGAQ